MVKNRKYGLDALRIFSMCGIIALHIIGQGGLMLAADKAHFNYWLIFFADVCFLCSVNVFALLSGYLCCEKKKLNSYRAFELLFIVFLYSAIITLIFLIFMPEKFNGIKDIIKGVFPMLLGKYWYITCYIPVLLLAPFFNVVIQNIENKHYRVLLFVVISLFSIIPSIISRDLFFINGGYSFVWLSICYFIGAYLKKDQNSRLNKYIYILIFFVLALIVTGGNYVVYKLTGMNIQYMFMYSSPFELAMAVCLFRFFENIKINKGFMKKALVALSSGAFDVYIIHSHSCIFENIIKGNFAFLSELNPFFIILSIILIIFSVYIVFAMIGYLRIKLFKAIKLQQLFSKLTKDKLSYSLDK